MRLCPQREVSYFPIEASDVEWFQSETGTPLVTAHVMKVDLQQRTITLPAGEFNLDYFLCIIEDIQLRLPQ